MSREALKPIRMSLEASSSIHANVSAGYYQVTCFGKRFVPYEKNELGEIHNFINPRRKSYNRMKWTKTHKWKNQAKAKASKWKYTPTYRGLNTVSR